MDALDWFLRVSDIPRLISNSYFICDIYYLPPQKTFSSKNMSSFDPGATTIWSGLKWRQSYLAWNSHNSWRNSGMPANVTNFSYQFHNISTIGRESQESIFIYRQSGRFLSGHSQLRPPSLMWLQILQLVPWMYYHTVTVYSFRFYYILFFCSHFSTDSIAVKYHIPHLSNLLLHVLTQRVFSEQALPTTGR